jgi:hypothetical protein
MSGPQPLVFWAASACLVVVLVSVYLYRRVAVNAIYDALDRYRRFKRMARLTIRLFMALRTSSRYLSDFQCRRHAVIARRLVYRSGGATQYYEASVRQYRMQLVRILRRSSPQLRPHHERVANILYPQRGIPNARRELPTAMQVRGESLGVRHHSANLALDFWAALLPPRIEKEDLADYMEDIDKRAAGGQRLMPWIRAGAAVFWTGVNAFGYLMSNVLGRARSGS